MRISSADINGCDFSQCSMGVVPTIPSAQRRNSTADITSTQDTRQSKSHLSKRTQRTLEETFRPTTHESQFRYKTKTTMKGKNMPPKMQNI